MASPAPKEIYDLTRKAIRAGYRKLFPLSMLTVVLIGVEEYQRRTARYEEFCRRILAKQKEAVDAAQQPTD